MSRTYRRHLTRRGDLQKGEITGLGITSGLVLVLSYHEMSSLSLRYWLVFLRKPKWFKLLPIWVWLKFVIGILVHPVSVPANVTGEPAITHATWTYNSDVVGTRLRICNRTFSEPKNFGFPEAHLNGEILNARQCKQPTSQQTFNAISPPSSGIFRLDALA